MLRNTEDVSVFLSVAKGVEELKRQHMETPRPDRLGTTSVLSSSLPILEHLPASLRSSSLFCVYTGLSVPSSLSNCEASHLSLDYLCRQGYQQNV